MSDWSSFEKDKQIRDVWRQYLSESTQIDERAGFFAGMEAGARKAAGIGQRPDTKAPGVAGKVRPGAMQLLKKKIREALDALLESTTSAEYDAAYIALTVILDDAVTAGVDLSTIDFATLEEVRTTLAEAAVNAAGKDLSQILRSTVDNYETKPDEETAEKLKKVGIDPETPTSDQEIEAAAKKIAAAEPKAAAAPATTTQEQDKRIAKAKKELQDARRAWQAVSAEESATTPGKTARLKASMLLSDFGLPKEVVRKVRLKWLQLQTAGSPAGAAAPAGAPAEKGAEESGDYDVDADTLRDLVAAGDLTHGPESGSKPRSQWASGLQHGEAPEPSAAGGLTDPPQEWADPSGEVSGDFTIDDYGSNAGKDYRPQPTKPSQFGDPRYRGSPTPTADQGKEWTPMSDAELKKQKDLLKKANVQESNILSESEIKRFKLLAGVK